MILYGPWCGSNFGMTEPWNDDNAARGLCARCMVAVMRGELPVEPKYLKDLGSHRKTEENPLGGILPSLGESVGG
jgi:hypothetical protein